MRDLFSKFTDIDIKNSIPILHFSLFGLSFLIWKDFKFLIEFCETEPYTPNGDIPLIFVQFGWLALVFENKMIYKFMYKRKYGYELEI